MRVLTTVLVIRQMTPLLGISEVSENEWTDNSPYDKTDETISLEYHR